MARKAAEKIVDAFALLLEGFDELQDKVVGELGAAPKKPANAIDDDNSKDEDAPDEDEDLEALAEIEEALATEVRAALESFLDGEDYSVEEIATIISHLTAALEEIDPDVFTGLDGDLEEVEEEYDYDDDEDESAYDLDEEYEGEPTDDTDEEENKR